MEESKHDKFFFCGVGRQFGNCLIRAADGDQMVTMMYRDNLDKFPAMPKDRVKELIRSGKFKEAVAAIRWYDTNEGADFWVEIFNNIRNGVNYEPI